MIEIIPGLWIDERDLHFDFIRAAGPGGQNVNKVASAAQLRFDVYGSSLPVEIKTRLVRLSGKRLTQEGILVIEARKYRTQEQNKEDALARLTVMIEKASIRPKPRKQTKPTAASRERRIKEKKLRGDLKRHRQNKSHDL